MEKWMGPFSWAVNLGAQCHAGRGMDVFKEAGEGWRDCCV